MKIGVDIRCLDAPITGIGRYTIELLKRMPQYGHQWYLYSHRDMTNASVLAEKSVALVSNALGT